MQQGIDNVTTVMRQLIPPLSLVVYVMILEKHVLMLLSKVVISVIVKTPQYLVDPVHVTATMDSTTTLNMNAKNDRLSAQLVTEEN